MWPKIPTRFLALVRRYLIWSFQLSLLSNTTPKYLICETCLIWEPFVVMEKESIYDNLDTEPKSIASILAHWAIAQLMLDCHLAYLWWQKPASLYKITVSSAYIRTLLCTAASGRSFMYRINKRIDPWGTPTVRIRWHTLELLSL